MAADEVALVQADAAAWRRRRALGEAYRRSAALANAARGPRLEVSKSARAPSGAARAAAVRSMRARQLEQDAKKDLPGGGAYVVVRVTTADTRGAGTDGVPTAVLHFADGRATRPLALLPRARLDASDGDDVASSRGATSSLKRSSQKKLSTSDKVEAVEPDEAETKQSLAELERSVFPRGSVRAFRLRLPPGSGAAAPIEGMTLAVEAVGLDSSWLCEGVEVERLVADGTPGGALEVTRFECGMWIDEMNLARRLVAEGGAGGDGAEAAGGIAGHVGANGEAARFSNAGLVAQAAASGGLGAQEEGDAPTVAEFHVTVYTSDVRGAGTDAPSVRLALAGDGWDSGPRELHEIDRQATEGKSRVLFARGAADVFVLSVDGAARLGPPNRLVISHGAGGLEPRWHLARIEVVDPAIGEVLAFNCNRWLDAGGYATTLLLDSTGGEGGDANAARLETYELTLVTADVRGAGTQAAVEVELVGRDGRGSACRSGLCRLAAGADTFARGHEDTFELRCVGVDKVEALRVRHDGSGLSPEWLLARAELRSKSRSRVWHFPFHRWLEDEVQGGQSDVEIASGAPPLGRGSSREATHERVHDLRNQSLQAIQMQGLAQAQAAAEAQVAAQTAMQAHKQLPMSSALDPTMISMTPTPHVASPTLSTPMPAGQTHGVSFVDKTSSVAISQAQIPLPPTVMSPAVAAAWAPAQPPAPIAAPIIVAGSALAPPPTMQDLLPLQPLFHQGAALLPTALAPAAAASAGAVAAMALPPPAKLPPQARRRANPTAPKGRVQRGGGRGGAAGRRALPPARPLLHDPKRYDLPVEPMSGA